MKYRLKIITHKTGRTEYYAQKKRHFIWMGLARDGECGYNMDCMSRDSALEAIDLNYAGNFVKQQIIIEYINK